MNEKTVSRRMHRLNSLLKEVISDVIHKVVQDPDIHRLLTVTKVEVAQDVRNAKVFISVIGNDTDKKKTVDALNRSAGFIGVHSAKQVVLRFFPTLLFKIDNAVETHAKISDLVDSIQEERRSRDS
jgi:ribosome-binding factor A